jgi:hypothetical protein
MTKLGMTKLIRKYSFLVVVVTAVFLGVACVPSGSAGYEIFYLGGVRGLYNSAWLGTLGAMLCCILLWLPGFYLLRSQISEDTQLKMEQMIAATAISKIKHLFLKAGTNLLVLVILQALFLVSLAVMQLIRGENFSISILAYLSPFVLVTFPALCVAAALAVLFDVVPFLKGAFGNILIFIVWVTSSSVSVAMPKNSLDMFGIGFMLEQILLSAKLQYPDISTNSGSFGYYQIDKVTPTFSFEGVNYDKVFLLARLMWISLSILLIILATVIFRRFKNEKVILPFTAREPKKQEISQDKNFSHSKAVILPTIERTHKPAFLQMVALEMKILLSGSIWWYVSAIVGLIVFLLLPRSLFLRWSCIVLLLPIGLWSKMGCYEKQFRTEAMILSSCSPELKWWSSFIAGTLISFILSIPILSRFIIFSLYTNVAFWLIGVLFVSSIAMTLGRLSKTSRFFEAVYIMLFYFGEINGLRTFDFLGLTGNKIPYLFVSVLLISFSLIIESGKRGNLR